MVVLRHQDQMLFPWPLSSSLITSQLSVRVFLAAQCPIVYMSLLGYIRLSGVQLKQTSLC